MAATVAVVLFGLPLLFLLFQSGQPILARRRGDFPRWKDHDAYQQALERLLSDLGSRGHSRPGHLEAPYSACPVSGA
jgi:hypothetical protein